MQRPAENAGVNKIKRKRRDLERLLKKPGLSAEKKQATERALAVIAEDLDQAMKRNKTKKIAQKYHMVRFFERKKAQRALKKSNTARTVADFYYVLEFPKDQKYIALFVPNGSARNNQVYKNILSRVQSGELTHEKALESVQEKAKKGKEDQKSQSKSQQPKPKNKKAKQPEPESEESSNEEEASENEEGASESAEESSEEEAFDSDASSSS